MFFWVVGKLRVTCVFKNLPVLFRQVVGGLGTVVNLKTVLNVGSAPPSSEALEGQT